MKVYEKIRTYIDEHELNHTTIAEKAGIDLVAFTEILEGTRILNADDLRAICLVLSVYPEKFMETDLQKNQVSNI